MPRGFWDYGINPDSAFTSPEIGLAEHAARLGSMSAYDRLGEVLFMEGFEHGLARGDFYVVGSGNSLLLHTGTVRTGGYSVLLAPAAVAGNEAGWEINTTPPGLTKIGVEFWIATDSGANLWYCYLEHHRSGQAWRWGLRYSRVTGVLATLDAAGAWATLATGITLSQTIPPFHVVKLVGNPSDGAYLRAIVAGVFYDLSSLAGQSITPASTPSLRFLVSNLGDGVLTANIIVDDIIITYNEP